MAKDQLATEYGTLGRIMISSHNVHIISLLKNVIISAICSLHQLPPIPTTIGQIYACVLIWHIVTAISDVIAIFRGMYWAPMYECAQS